MRTIPQFPASIELQDLQRVNAEYDIKKIEKHNDLYFGGESFRQHIDRYLVKRQSEDESGLEAVAAKFASFNPKSSGRAMDWKNELQKMQGSAIMSYSARKRRAPYIPIVSGMLDFMVAAVLQNPPSIVAADPSKSKDPNLLEKVLQAFIGVISKDKEVDSASDYWHELNRNANGYGQDLASVMREALLEIFLHKRAYLSTWFPSMDEAGNLADQEDAGEMDARICLLRAIDVDDWSVDVYGNLEWVRTHRKSMTRSSPEKQPDMERHTWTYITSDAVYEYVAEWETVKPPPPSEPINCVRRGHELGRLPVIQIKVHDGLWVMERLADTVLALFNRQAAATWSLDMMAFAVLFVMSKRPLTGVADASVGAVQLDVGDTASFVHPNTGIFDVNQKDIDRLKDELFMAIQAMVLVAASKDQNDRQSGVAKQRDFGALSTLLEAFAAPLRDALEQTVRLIQDARADDDVVLAVQGLDKFDVQSLELKIKNADAFTKLQNAPDSAKRWVLLDTSLAMTSQAPAEIREQVVTEMMTKDMQPDPATMPNGGVAKSSKPESVAIRQPNTQEVKV